jgi:7,8-dihydroneopterin aldolase/epimerase/oxygenase
MLLCMHCELILKNLSLSVKLGYSEEERALPQQVLVQIKLQFADVPVACTTDNLHDTLCYAVLSYELQNFCDHHSFKLIENLAYQLYQQLKKKITDMTLVKVNVFLCVTKNPPLANLETSSFAISD